MLNSKQIGNITEVECMLAFLKLGYNVLQPYGDCERYDFVVEINGKFYKMQCKTASTDDDGNTFKFSCRSSHKVNGKCVNTHYSSNDCDYFCTFWDGKCYIIPQSICSHSKRLRVIPPENNQLNGILFAKDYELEVMLQK